MKKNEKRRQIAVELVWFLLVGGGEIAFSGCDQIQEFLGMGGDDESAPQPEPEPGPPQEPDTYLADGGAVSFVQDGGQWYEAHIFTEEVPGSLSFIDTGTASIEAVDYLIVGGDDDRPARDNPGGGGADGLLYKTNQTLALTEGSVGVTVGQGGAGGTPQSQGGDGGSSAIGTIVVPGGGGGGGATSNMNGRPGGSGGGAGAGNESTSGFAGTGKQNTNGNEGDLDPGLCGNDGNIGDIDIDAGGGGTHGNSGGAGGQPWSPPDEAAWIVTVSGASEFSRGGSSSGTTVPNVNEGFGNGGSIVPTGSGGAGYDSIVIIRFPR